jgi:NADH-quinone oxidoreductase subunit G
VAGAELKLERLTDLPIYFADAIARRSEPLIRTADSQAPLVTISGKIAEALGVKAGDMVTVQQGEGSATLVAAVDGRLPENVVRVAAGHQLTSSLGAMFGPISIEKA